MSVHADGHAGVHAGGPADEPAPEPAVAHVAEVAAGHECKDDVVDRADMAAVEPPGRAVVRTDLLVVDLHAAAPQVHLSLRKYCPRGFAPSDGLT